MAMCDICKKGTSYGIQVSHSHRRTNRTWKGNVRKMKVLVNGAAKRLNVCTSCLRSNKVQKAV